MFKLLNITLVSAFLVSCDSPFDYKPEVYAHRSFRLTINKNRVSGNDLIKWAEESNTSAPYEKIPYILVQELKINSNPHARFELADSYIHIYRKLVSGQYGMKQKSVIYDDGEEKLGNGKINVANSAYLFISVLKVELEKSENGTVPSKGEFELRRILETIDL
jgi:hypothetical protein